MPVCVNQQQEKKSKYCLFASCESEKNKFQIIEQLLNNPLPQRNSHGQLLMHSRKENLTKGTVLRALLLRSEKEREKF